MTTTQTQTETDAYIANTPRYHTNKDAAYVLPNDEVEHTRLEQQAAHLQAIMNDNIIHSPIPTGVKDAKMLDVGCGTGIVTDFIGNRFPNAQVYGLDISPVPVHIRSHPTNRGMDWTCARSLPQWLAEAGFQDIEVKKYRWPYGGAWQKDPVWKAWGDFVVKEMKGLVWHVIPRTLEGEGYSAEEIAGFRKEALRNVEAEEGKYWNFWVVTGRKADA
ncbi:hypothetical protein CERZMDRAFT_38447 [Cercospora zeae-maydis SCOH1-5]|uniref:Methyltransferase type 12 domain-containing protein n=1 Tax=Cercospora zeae-maydis SCOH1-5 TaxID=717836 RepID=A0A6A6FKV5_9PEZI|nr:hypothetical protein CERZMDRAFT_38447 [Cercospora zeae-maydis SCOH1-5]